MGTILIIDDDVQVGDMPVEVPGARAAAFALVFGDRSISLICKFPEAFEK